jgi:hypothetical protein
LGEWNVPELMQRMPASLYAKWQAFDRIEPISLGWRGDHQAGVIASTMANLQRAHGRAPWKIKDFIPEFGKRQKTARDLYGEMRAWALLNGAHSGATPGKERQQ